MNPLRRALLLAAAAPAASLPLASLGEPGEPGDPVRRGRLLAFPRDHGAHPGASIEWWYATGWAGESAAPRWGFQVTFFRARTGLAGPAGGRFAATQLLFAHAAVTDLGAGRHLHAQRIARWNGDPAAALAHAGRDDAALRIGRWQLMRDGRTDATRWLGRIDGEFALELELHRTQPLLLQGDAGFSRKSPDEAHASHYYSEPQLRALVRLRLDGRELTADGRAWLDHEWSDSLMHPQAVGWDWIGMNLDDGSALMAFQLRRADGSTLWAGGSHRRAGQPARAFAPDEVRFVPGRRWTSPATAARYPVQWRVDTPIGSFSVDALLDAQELYSRASTGTLYWEGLARLLDVQGRPVGLGYLELTGYGQPLRLG